METGQIKKMMEEKGITINEYSSGFLDGWFMATKLCMEKDGKLVASASVVELLLLIAMLKLANEIKGGD